MRNKISVGIDIGTDTIKVIVSESQNDEQRSKPRIIGVGYAKSSGLRHGYIVNVDECAQSIKKAVTDAEKTSGYKITKTHLGIGGVGLSGAVFSSTLLLEEKGSEITKSDIEKISNLCETEIPESFILNKNIIHSIPLQFKIDGKVVLGKPVGLKGSKLECKMLFISCLSHHLKDMVDALGLCNITVEDVAASQLASSIAILTKTQQVAGCALINIGAETVSVSVFENGSPLSLEIFPIGGVDITNDIALGLKISIEEAEKVKLSKPDSTAYPRKKLDEIINARISDIFELVESHLKKIGRSGLLPAGAVITGSGSLLPQIESQARQNLKLPAKKSGIKFENETKYPLREGSWPIAYGLTILGINYGENDSPISIISTIGIKNTVSKFKNRFIDLIKKILP